MAALIAIAPGNAQWKGGAASLFDRACALLFDARACH
jgi:hypothetical protein